MRNPLLLSLYIFTFQRNASIPENKSVFYERVINLLFTEHDNITKIGYNRIKKTDLTQGQFIDILSVFSFRTYFNSMYEWSAKDASTTLKIIRDKNQGLVFKDNDFIEDMKVSLSLWVEDGGRISFAHRSLQEYFTALYIKQLNDTNKYSRIADKINTRSSDPFENRAHINLFSLCEELDFVTYSKYFQLPLLEAMLANIEDVQGDELIELFYTRYCLTKLVIVINLEKIKVVSVSPYEKHHPIFLTSIWGALSKMRDSLYDTIFQIKNPLKLMDEYKVTQNKAFGNKFEIGIEILTDSKLERKFIKDYCNNLIPVLNQFKSELKNKINQINQDTLRLEKKQKLYDDLYDDLI